MPRPFPFIFFSIYYLWAYILRADEQGERMQQFHCQLLCEKLLTSLTSSVFRYNSLVKKIALKKNIYSRTSAGNFTFRGIKYGGNTETETPDFSEHGARNALRSQRQTDCRVPCDGCDLPTHTHTRTHHTHPPLPCCRTAVGECACVCASAACWVFRGEFCLVLRCLTFLCGEFPATRRNNGLPRSSSLAGYFFVRH